MRIVSGEFGGRVIQSLESDALRPTSDRVREAIFSSLQSLLNLQDAKVLDLYAGTGAFGLEAISRGAASVVFVENNEAHADVIRKNIQSLGISQRSRLLVADALSSLAILPAELPPGGVGPFQLVFADPPYKEHPGSAVLQQVLNAGLVAPGAILIVEGPIKLEMSDELVAEYKDLSAAHVKAKQYGDTIVHYYRVEGHGHYVK